MASAFELIEGDSDEEEAEDGFGLWLSWAESKEEMLMLPEEGRGSLDAAAPGLIDAIENHQSFGFKQL